MPGAPRYANKAVKTPESMCIYSLKPVYTGNSCAILEAEESDNGESIMKRIFSFFVTITLLLSMVSVLSPAVFAENEYPAYLTPEEHRDTWTIEGYTCDSRPGGQVSASGLESGKSYFFEGDVTLNLDRDLECPVLYADGDLVIRGTGSLTSKIINAVKCLTVESGTVVCTEMTVPPEPDTALCNGLTGAEGVKLNGGIIQCPKILCGPETFVVSGGEIHTNKISAIYGYSQSDGSVEAEEIWAREGMDVSGGTLSFGNASGMYFRFSGGDITITGRLETEHNDDQSVIIEFPMYITQPDGSRYHDGQFLDADGKPAQTVRITGREVSHPFRDVRFEAYYYDAMVWAYENEPRITEGVGADSFGPDRGCTRGQIVTFLWRAAGCPAPSVTTLRKFTDLKPGAFYEKAVAWAVEKGITKGTDDTHFSPDATCTRGQVVTFLYRAAGSPEPGKAASAFTDLKPGAFYEDAVAWAVEKGVTKGIDDTHFRPDATCTRGQVVTFLYRAK